MEFRGSSLSYYVNQIDEGSICRQEGKIIAQLITVHFKRRTLQTIQKHVTRYIIITFRVSRLVCDIQRSIIHGFSGISHIIQPEWLDHSRTECLSTDSWCYAWAVFMCKGKHKVQLVWVETEPSVRNYAAANRDPVPSVAISSLFFAR